MSMTHPRAILVPAYNEALTIAGTLRDLAEHQPSAFIVVIDNASKDDTSAIAAAALAEYGLQGLVLHEPRKGKANALRAGMSRVDARVYAWIDADQTYPAAALEAMFRQVELGEADMVCGDRLSRGRYAAENKRPFHGLGNDLVRNLIGGMFGREVADPMTGLRVMSCAVAHAYPLLPQGFEVEVDLTAFALDNRLQLIETPIDYRDRPAGSFSKLSTFRDGFRVLVRLANLYRHYRPMAFYGAAALTLAVVSLVFGSVPVTEFIRTGYIAHLPTSILAAGIGVIAVVILVSGLVLDSVALRSRQQIEQAFAAIRRRQQFLPAHSATNVTSLEARRAHA